MPFHRYVTRLRIRHAARDIRNDHYPKGIGRRYGFSTLPSFTRAFRREIGISPREYYYGNYTIPDMPLPEDVLEILASFSADLLDEKVSVLGIAYALKRKLDSSPSGIVTFTVFSAFSANAGSEGVPDI